MQANKKAERALYTSYCEILKHHGIIVLGGYLLFVKLGEWVGVTRWLLWLGRMVPSAYDKDLCKSKPWWQDLSVLIVLILTIGIVYAGWSQRALSVRLAQTGAWIILLDTFIYHSRILWFDDLQLGRTVRTAMVWSHRRIFFQALVNFMESVFLFPVIYRGCAKGTFWELSENSFTVATTLSAPETLKNCQTWVQVAFSLFILITVISIIASVGYTRGELAPSAKEES